MSGPDDAEVDHEQTLDRTARALDSLDALLRDYERLVTRLRHEEERALTPKEKR